MSLASNDRNGIQITNSIQTRSLPMSVERNTPSLRPKSSPHSGANSECALSEWTEWTCESYEDCGVGIAARFRFVDDNCNDTSIILTEERDCEIPCQCTSQIYCRNALMVADCVWESWSAWTTCNATCDGGITTRTRTKIEEQNGGAPCIGEDYEHLPCNIDPCAGIRRFSHC